MSKLAYGPPTWHVLASSGPQVNPLHFYSTTYSAMHGREQGKAAGRGLGRHRGTGYASNFRPGVYYSSKLDEIDNPTMGKLLTDNYDSLTKRHYVGYKGADGCEAFPSNIHPTSSGFAHNLPRTTPTSKLVRSVHVDTAHSSSLPVYAKPSPLLHTLQPRDPVTKENAGHGPSSLSTEYHTRFPKQPFRDEGLQSSRHTQKEKTGFTHAYNIEPVTFRPHENFTGSLPGHMTWRPTGSSIMKKDFYEPQYMKGGEPFQAVTAKADRSNGYIKGSKATADVQPKAAEMVGYTQASQVHTTVLDRVKKEDPAEYSILTHPQQYSSLTQRNFQGRQRNPPPESQRLAREQVGGKEMTGFSENNCPMVEPSDKDTARFYTHYQHRFPNPNPLGSSREGYTSGGVQPPVYNGFSKSTQVHSFSDTSRPLHQLHPYVARSVMKRHPYADDDPHSHKVHSTTEDQ